jgi:hypothetical protein
MAQTNYTPIYLYSSGTTTNVPLAANLGAGELAINYTDGKLFYKDNNAAIQVIGWKTTPTTAGGTGLTSYAAGDLPYYASGSALSKLAIGTTNYVLTSSGTAPQYVAQSTLTVGNATNAVNVGTTDNTSSSSTYYPTLVSASSGNNPITTSSTKLSFVPSTGVLSITGANLSGLTASSAVATDASKNLVSVTNTGSGNNVLATSPTITTPTVSGNLTFTGTNPGVIFNNSNGLTNSTLNDYEVGTWTPTANSASGSITAYTAFGTYTKIGRIVLLQGNVTITTPGTATGQLQIQGLPFTAINSGTAGLTQFTGTCRETANTGVIYYVLSNINNTTAAIQNATNGGIVYLATYCYTFSISYEANF